MLIKSVFIKTFDSELARAKKESKAVELTGNKKEVHDLRGTLRRVEIDSAVIPKKQLRRRQKKYLNASKKLYRATTKVRDLDVMLERIQNYPALEKTKLPRSLEKKRERLVQRAIKRAEKLQDRDAEFSLDTISEAKLQKRFEKRVNDCREEIQSLLPLVLQNSKNVEELHRLRKTCKQLRYLLEIPNEDGVELERLKDWQKRLGELHDLDVILDYLAHQKQQENEPANRALQDLHRARQEKYAEFVSQFKRQSGKETSPVPIGAANEKLERQRTS